MKRIPLTQGQFALVDDEDYERLSKFKWHARRICNTNSYYAERKSLPDANGKRHNIYMHREVMNAKPGEHVDHIGHNTLDQQKNNLRLCSSGQNNSNQRTRSDNASGYKGVSWCEREKKWRAQLSSNGKMKSLGYHSTAICAAMAYDVAAVKYHGEFALTNKMLGLLP